MSEAIDLRDPDGNGLELYWDRPCEKWPRNADGSLAMFVENAESITQTLSLLVADNAVALLPALVERFQVPGVTFRPLRGTTAKWDLQVAWQRG